MVPPIPENISGGSVEDPRSPLHRLARDTPLVVLENYKRLIIMITTKLTILHESEGWQETTII